MRRGDDKNFLIKLNSINSVVQPKVAAPVEREPSTGSSSTETWGESYSLYF